MKKIFLFLGILLFSLVSVSAALTDDLVSYYGMDESTGSIMIDGHGSNNLTYAGDLPSQSTGKLNYAQDFDGNADYVNLPDYNLDNNALSMSLWVNSDVAAGGAETWLVYYSDTEGTILVRINDGGNININFNDQSEIISGDLTGWNHLVITTSESGTAYIYINGVEEHSEATGNSPNYGSRYLGQNSVKGWDGDIDQLLIYNRQISEAEVIELYGGGDGYAYPFITPSAEITLTSPANDSTISDIAANFSVSMDAQEGFNISNVTYYIWDSDGQIHNQTTVTITNGNQTANNTLSIDDFVLDNYEWNAEFCWGNATFSNCTFAENNFTFNVIPFSEVAEEFSPNVLEGDTSLFSINLSIITFERLSEILFVYNGTEFPTSSVEYAENQWFVSINKTIPEVDGVEQVEFYWKVLLESGFTQNSTINNQTILELSIDDCSTYTNQIFNFSIIDETTQDFLDGSAQNTSLKIDMTFSYLDNSAQIIQFSKGYSEVNPARVCMNNSIGNSTLRMDAVVEYTAADRFVEFYNIQDYTFNESTGSQNITLYNLKESEGLEFRVTYKGQDFIPVTDLILQIQRKYIDEGVFKTIEIPMSGTNGYTIAHLVPNDIIYNLIFIKNGSVLDTFTEVVADCQNPTITECEINLNALITGSDLFGIIEDDEFFSSLTFNKATREVSSTYGIISGTSGTTSLNVTLIDNYGNNTACSDSLIASGGTLTCEVPSNFGDAVVYARVILNGEIKREGFVSLKETPKDQYAGVIIFSTMILLLFIFGIGVSDNPAITGVFFILGALLLVGLNVFYSTSLIGTGATILWFIVAVILVMFKGGSKR